MSGMQLTAIRYIEQLSDSKLCSAIGYLRYLCGEDYPLDDFDYELARRADMDLSEDAISFDELLDRLQISHEELQDN